MASIRSQLQLSDAMTSVLRKMNGALLTCLDSFEAMERASGRSVDVENISNARSQLIGVNQQLEEIGDTARHVNDETSRGIGLTDNMIGKVAQLAATYLSVRSAVGFVRSAIEDAMEAQNIDTQLAVSLKNQGLDKGSYDQIKDAAKQYGMYTQTAMTGAAAEFATYLSDADAIESMMGTLSNYMVGMTGGGELDTAQVVDFATQLGKVLNGSFDGIAKKGFEVSDAQKEIIQNGTDMEKAAVVADIINESWGNLYECMANTPEGQLITLQNTINQMKEDMGAMLLPVVLTLVQTVQDNLPTIEILIGAIGMAIQALAPILSFLLQLVADVANFFIENWSWIEPIIWGIVAAFVAYEAITIAQTIAQWALNSALLANPITWIILIIGLVVIAMYKWIQSVGGLQNAWEICKQVLVVAWAGLKVAFFTAVNVIMNLVDSLAYCWQAAGVAIANFMGDMKVSVLTILQNMINGAIDIINDFIGLLNCLPGVEIDAVAHVTFASMAAAENEAAKQSREAELNATQIRQGAERAAREATLAAAQSELSQATQQLVDLYAQSKAEAAANEVDSLPESTASDYIDQIFADDNIGKNLGNTAENTETGAGNAGRAADNAGSAAASLKEITEDLKYLRDIAEQEAVNRFTTAEVHIDMTGMTNRIESDVDLDGVLTAFTEGFTEALEIAAEGVHA